MKQILLLYLLVLLLFTISSCGNQPSPSKAAELSPPPAKQVQTAPPPKTNETEEGSDNMQQPEKTASHGERSKNNILIAYFSLADTVPEGADASAHATPAIGNTEAAAREIQRQVSGDLFPIKTVQAYPASHQECSAVSEREMRANARPELSTHVENMAGYDTIYLGFPIWWYIEPMAVRTFLEEYDFSGKTIIPFCTTLGAGVEESEDDIKALCPNSTVLNGLTLHTGRDNFADPVSSWLSRIGTKKIKL